MTFLLALLPLLSPAQESATDFLPADSLLVAEISAEPIARLGDQTIVAQLFQQEGLSQLVSPIQTEVENGLAMASSQMGFDLTSLLMGSRMYLAVPQAALFEEDGQITFAAELAADIAQGVNVADMLNNFGQGAWWQSGRILVGTVHTQEMDGIERRMEAGMQSGTFEASPLRQGDLMYLQGLVRGGLEGVGLSAQPIWTGMTNGVRDGNQMLSVWMRMDIIWQGLLSGELGESFEPEMGAVLTELGVTKLQGVGYSMGISGSMIEDHIVMHGEGFAASLAPQAMLEAVNLPALVGILPHDTMRAQASAINFNAIADMIQRAVEMAAEAGREEIPAEAEPIIAAVDRGLRAVGPVVVAAQRTADIDNGGTGDFWMQVRDAAALNEVLDMIPAEVWDGVKAGMAMSGMPELVVETQGQRFVVTESSAQPSTVMLSTQAEFQPTVDYLKRFPTSNVMAIEFIHRDLIVEGLSFIRSEGDGWLGMIGEMPEGMTTKILPQRAVLESVLRPATSVATIDGNGLRIHTRSPFGWFPTSMLVAVPQMVSIFEQIGMYAGGAEFDEEEF